MDGVLAVWQHAVLVGPGIGYIEVLATQPTVLNAVRVIVEVIEAQVDASKTRETQPDFEEEP